MINLKDQEELFRLIADYLSADIDCLCIGGTAMMFLGYKTTTKDIDLVFKIEKDRSLFIEAIEKLGYVKKSVNLVYPKNIKKIKRKPLIFSRGEERFDLFVKDVFGFTLNFSSENFVQKQDFIGKKELIIKVLPKEYLILLKVVTAREKDYEDIESIVNVEKDLNWDFIIDEAISQRERVPWILIDLEEKMQKLSKKIFIKERYFDKIYKSEKMLSK